LGRAAQAEINLKGFEKKGLTPFANDAKIANIKTK
jgi:hypothetical protein